jgi:putative exporter of polyketide antibiotics
MAFSSVSDTLWITNSFGVLRSAYMLQARGSTLSSAMMWTSPLSWLGLAASFPIGLRLARLIAISLLMGNRYLPFIRSIVPELRKPIRR